MICAFLGILALEIWFYLYTAVRFTWACADLDWICATSCMALVITMALVIKSQIYTNGKGIMWCNVFIFILATAWHSWIIKTGNTLIDSPICLQNGCKIFNCHSLTQKFKWWPKESSKCIEFCPYFKRMAIIRQCPLSIYMSDTARARGYRKASSVTDF